MAGPAAAGETPMSSLSDDRLSARQAADLAGADPILNRGVEFLKLIAMAAGAEPGLPPVMEGTDRLRADVLRILQRSPRLAGAANAAEAARLFQATLAAAPDPETHLRLAHAGLLPGVALGAYAPAEIGMTDPVYRQVALRPPPRTAPSGIGSVVLIVKLTRRCNLRCLYCNDWREGADSAMTPATQALMLRRIAEDDGLSSARLIWHGGEPALLGLRRMLGFLWLQARLLRSGQHVSHSVQTNGTVISPPVLALWRIFGFAVSVSLDGPRRIHDRQRPGRHGEGSFAAAARGIAELRAAGILAGGLVVVTEEIAELPAAELVEGLVEAGLSRVGFLPVRPESGRGLGSYLLPEAFAAFLVRVFDHLRRNPQVPLDVREIDALHQAWSRKPTGFCELDGPCTGQYFGIDPDGTVQHCDKFLGDGGAVLGHLDTTGFAALRRAPELARLAQRAASARRQMSACPWFGACQGWCPHESHIADLRGQPKGCCGLARVFDHFAAVASGELP